MIRHRRGNEFLLIAQDDHARFSGRLLQAIGNERFAMPLPLLDTVQGAALHDAGWPLHDDEPTLNSHGQPTHLFETPAEVVTRVWNESAKRAAETGGPYCGLLVSLHVLNLSMTAQHGGLGNEMNSNDAHARFAVNKFQHLQIERQEALRKTLGLRPDLPRQGGLARPGANADEDALRFNLGYLRMADALSLDACCSEEVFQTFPGVYPAAGAASLTINFAHPTSFAIAIAPWPFRENRVCFKIPSRRVPAIQYSSQAHFREVFRDAPTEQISLSIRSL